MSMVWDWPVPDIQEIQRALDWLGWFYDSDPEIASSIYREKYGDLPCFAMSEPDGGLLLAVHALYKAVRWPKQ